MLDLNVSCRGLRSVLRKFDDNGEHVSGTHWSIANGGYDLWWELYYDNIPVVDCVQNEIKNLCLNADVFDKVFAVIKEEYGGDRFYPIKRAT